MKKYIYIVIHNLGIDGNYVQAVFSNKKEAQKLVEMYNKSSYSSEYDFYISYKVQIDKYNINKFELVTKDGWTTLQYAEEVFI